MSFTRKEWEELRKDGVRRNPRKLADAREAAGAAIASEKLTGSAEWDWYVNELALMRDARKRDLEMCVLKMIRRGAVPDAELRAWRETALCLREAIDILTHVEQMPEAALKGGAQALELLREEEEDASPDAAA